MTERFPTCHMCTKEQEECIECQQKHFEELAEINGNSLALFYCCLIYDVPFELKAVPNGESGKYWADYLEKLNAKGLSSSENKIFTFLDGMTDITHIFGADLKKGEFSRAVNAEKSARTSQPGTAAQRKAWGTGNEEKPYTNADYKELDRLFATLASRLVSSGGYDTQQEYILRLCARMSLEMQKALDDGKVNKAQTLNKMIQENLASENLRKKDEKPIEDVRIDSIVESLEKAGLVKSGKILPLPDLQKKLLERLGALGGKPSHKYPYTLDAADQMIHIIINTMRSNDGLGEITEFPDNMRFSENVAPEFADTPSEVEENVYQNLGLARQEKPK